MGLNLAIRRVVFTSLSKFDGIQERPLTIGEIKQIAGRAGRWVLLEGEYCGGEMAALHASMTAD